MVTLPHFHLHISFRKHAPGVEKPSLSLSPFFFLKLTSDLCIPFARFVSISDTHTHSDKYLSKEYFFQLHQLATLIISDTTPFLHLFPHLPQSFLPSSLFFVTLFTNLLLCNIHSFFFLIFCLELSLSLSLGPRSVYMFRSVCLSVSVLNVLTCFDKYIFYLYIIFFIHHTLYFSCFSFFVDCE